MTNVVEMPAEKTLAAAVPPIKAFIGDVKQVRFAIASLLVSMARWHPQGNFRLSAMETNLQTASVLLDCAIEKLEDVLPAEAFMTAEEIAELNRPDPVPAP
jgi:hypothetical protein